MYNFGDIDLDQTVYIPFNTFDSDGASVTVTDLADSDIHVHKDGGTTQQTLGASESVIINFDGVTGNHLVVIDTSASSDVDFYEEGHDYQVRLEGITVDTQTLNVWIGTFSIVNRNKDADVIKIDGDSVNGNAATLTLKQLDIQNNAGSALIAKSTGNGGHGIEALGNTNGNGIDSTGGTGGDGIEATGGSTSGHGIEAQGNTSGAGIKATGANFNAGIHATGNQTAAGIQGSGGSSGSGIAGAGGASGGNGISATSTDGDGISAAGSNGKHGIHSTGQGGGSGIEANGGATGPGLKATGGATSGAGIYANAQNNNDAGMELVKHGTGKDIDADEIDNILEDTGTTLENRQVTIAGDVANVDGSSIPTAAAIKTAMEAEGTSDLDTIADAIENGTYGLSAIETLVDEIESLLKNGTYGLSAIRVRGDAAWITGGGGALTEILNIQPLIPNSVDIANTATVRIALALTNMLDDLPSDSEIDPGTISIDRKAIGGTSWTSVVNDAACSELAGIIYYDEVFNTGTGYVEGDSLRITFKNQCISVDANDYEITGNDGWIFQTFVRVTMRGTDSAALATGVNVTSISGDSNAADNLEATYDGSGYTNPEAPAKQSQLSSLANVGAAINKVVEEDNTGAAIKSITFVGSQTNTYASAAAVDGTNHQIDDTGNAIDIVYGFDIGGDGVPSQLNMTGYLTGINDELNVFGYDFVDSGWVQIGILDGKTLTVNDENTYPMFVNMVGTSSSDLGKVYVRFQNTGQSDPTLYVDQLFISYSVVRRTTGYNDGAIWVDTVNGVAGTENYVNGTADNPVLTWADALTLSAAIGVKRFRIVNGSAITLTADSSNITIDGHEYSIALNGQECLGIHINDAEISGTGLVDGSAGTAMHFVDCLIGDVSLDRADMRSCGFEGTIIITDAETYIFDSCFAADTGGVDPPVIDMDDQGATIGLRDYNGGIKIKTMSSSDKITIQGRGHVTIDSSCDDGGTIGISGNMRLTDNVVGTFSGTLNDDARIDVDQINAEADSALSDYDPPTRAELTTDKESIITEVDANETKIDALNNISNANVTTACASALTTYDPPTRGELTTDKESIITEIDANETKIDALNNINAADVKTALEVDGGKLDHLWEMTEDDGGTRRLTENALEEAPSGAGLTATQDTNLTLVKDIMEGDATIDKTTTPWQLVVKKKSTSTELVKKDLKDVDGSNIAAVTTVIGQVLEP